MELTPFLLLPIAGGFALSSVWTRLRYLAARESGHRLYFRATLNAFYLLPVAVAVHVILFVHVTAYRVQFLPLLGDVFGLASSPVEMWGDPSRISLLMLSAIAGPILGLLLNVHLLAEVPWLALPPFLRRQFNQVTISQLDRALKNNDLERLMMRSALKGMPILLTLDNGKVYVGFSIRLPNPELERADVRILPLLSGYRDSATHDLNLTTNYDFVYKLEQIPQLSHLATGDFEVVIPVDRICSSHLFDLVAYEYFRSNGESPDDSGGDKSEDAANPAGETSRTEESH
jgi:hypothetical protein